MKSQSRFVMKSITSDQSIKVSAPTLWAAITSNHHLEKCHPYILRHTKNIADRGLSDEITYLNGVTFTREATAWMDGVGYDLKVGRIDEPKNEVAWRIEPLDSNSCKLSISVTPLAVEKFPKLFRGVALRLFVRRQVGLYLDAVTGGIKMWVETGKAIDKTAFPRHPWFCT
jgi:hypothetical protein